MNFELGADIDAARRLIKEDHFRIDREHLGDGHLLLIAAGQGGYRLADMAAFEIEAPAEIAGLKVFAALIDDAALADKAKAQGRDIGGNGHIEEKAIALAVFRDRPALP